MLLRKEIQLIVILRLQLTSCNNVGGYFPIWRAASRLLKTDTTHIFQFDKIFFFSLHAILGNTSILVSITHRIRFQNYCLYVQGLDRSIASQIESVFAEFPWVFQNYKKIASNHKNFP